MFLFIQDNSGQFMNIQDKMNCPWFYCLPINMQYCAWSELAAQAMQIYFCECCVWWSPSRDSTIISYIVVNNQRINRTYRMIGPLIKCYVYESWIIVCVVWQKYKRNSKKNECTELIHLRQSERDSDNFLHTKFSEHDSYLNKLHSA